MKISNELFNLVKQSDMTLIGYTFKDERIKDELISNFNYVFESFLKENNTQNRL